MLINLKFLFDNSPSRSSDAYIPNGLCVYIKRFLSFLSIHLSLPLFHSLTHSSSPSPPHIPLSTYPHLSLSLSIYPSISCSSHYPTSVCRFLTVTRRERRRRNTVYLCTYIYKIHENVHNARMCVTRSVYDYKFIM